MNLGGVIHLNKAGICIIVGAIVILFLYMLTGSSNHQHSDKINLKDLLKIAIKAAENGGREVVAVKDNITVKSKGLTKEGMVDSVTKADYLSHCSMKATLQHKYPTLNIISEEAPSACDKNQPVDFTDIYNVVLNNDQWENINDVTVWIDPLDATHEYTGIKINCSINSHIFYTEKLYPYVTTMVCVAVQGRPIIGVIHKPFFDEESKTSWAWVNKALSSNLHHTERQDNKLKIIISRSHSGEIRNILDKSMNNYEIISAAGAGYKVLEVTAGNVDAYVHMTAIKKWDICAGNAIINAMGGKMTTKFNKNIDYTDLTDVQNEQGLVVTMKNHNLFIGKF